MTDQNRERHSYAIVKRFLNNPTEERLRMAHNAITDHIYFGNVCDRCIQDDFGYCGLRRSKISGYDMFVKYCAPTFISLIDKKRKAVKGKWT